MTDKPEQANQNAEDSDDKDKNKRGVAEFLQAPRRKRKAFVILACRNLPPEIENSIAQFLRVNYKGVAIAQPKSTEEFIRLSNRQTVLIIYDDEFIDLDDGLKALVEIKRKKGTTTTPILFLSRDTAKLIEAYNRLMLSFHETDDYIDYMRAPPHHIFSKIRTGLVEKNRRRSRRYRANIGITYFNLIQDKFFPGHIIDLSIHGAMIASDDLIVFRANDQLKLHIPMAPYLPPIEGDFLKLSARVRRVHISGNQAGLSFEHMSDKQQLTLMRLLTEIVNSQRAKKPINPSLKGVAV